VVIELDCRGVPCPRPIIELAKAFPDVPVGEVVAIASDDPAARYDVPAWCRMRGQEYVGEEPAADGVPRYLVRKGATDEAASPP
jgi:tRNA 2-thiouridine synthesizing protein A